MNDESTVSSTGITLQADNTWVSLPSRIDPVFIPEQQPERYEELPIIILKLPEICRLMNFYFYWYFIIYISELIKDKVEVSSYDLVRFIRKQE